MGGINHSSLCAFNKYSFIYAYKGTFLQISSEDYSILLQIKEGKFDGYSGMISPEGGKYIAIKNGNKLSIIQPCYT